MSSNGFLLSLDLRIHDPPWPLIAGCPPSRRVVRAVALPSGAWTVCTADGESRRACLVGGWWLGKGALVGLRWRDSQGRKWSACTSLHDQVPGLRRRLLVRLRWPRAASRAPACAFPPGAG